MENNNSESKNIKTDVQNFGRFLSGMVMPNMGAFIAWGLITALFIPTGWIPNERLASLVDPMINFLLPLLIAFSGGKIVHGTRGGVIGAIAAMGVIAGADIPMFLGAMIMGPLGGFLIKKFDNLIEGKVKSGFEMLINNFSAGIMGMLLAILGFIAIGPVVSGLNVFLESMVDIIVRKGLLPLVSIFVEPAKVLFLNNAINHGVLGPIGFQEVKEVGKSIFFLVESNPGPGLGILLAYFVFGKGSAKQSTPSAMIIHFLGGIHEIYFPYVLMNPALILAVIAGGASGIFTFGLFNAGLVATPSPGSIFALLALAPRGSILGVVMGVLISTGVTFLVASIFVKSSSDKMEDQNLKEAINQVNDMKTQSKKTFEEKSDVVDFKYVRKIVFACDAGMGSSAMGASILKKKIINSGLDVSVVNSAINEIPDDADIIITHENLTDRAKLKAPNKIHISIKNFVDSPIYEQIVNSLLEVQSTKKDIESNFTNIDKNILLKKNIILNQKSTDKMKAIEFIGNLLADSGYVDKNYIDGMKSREKSLSTYIGNGIAIPHGDSNHSKYIINSGIVVVQYPNGIKFDDNVAYLLIGIAGKGDEHIKILSNLASVLEDAELSEEIRKTNDKEKIYNMLMERF